MTELHRRWAVRAFIGAWLAVQVIGPMSYYVWRHDRHDERFAWRMFSPTRMLRCEQPGGKLAFTVDGTPVPLDRVFHEGWLEIAKRGRLVVLEEMGAKLCADHPGSQVVLDLDCVELDGTHERWGGSDLCKYPRL
jgi:hypothetical protein